MILRRIELRSFRQFVEAQIDFDTGVTAIVGVNGSGKTTLLESVKFALYGEPRGKKESVGNMHHGGKVLVAIEFDLGSCRYRCERTLNDATFCAQVDGSWEKRAHTLTGVSMYVEKLIGLTCEQFCNSYFTEQKQIEFLKFKQANKQHEQIAQMLGIQLVEKAGKTAKETAKDRALAVALMESAIGDERVLQDDLKQKQLHLKVCEQDRSAAEVLLIEKSAEFNVTRPKAEDAKTATEIYHRLRNRKDIETRLKQELEAAETEVEKRAAWVEERKRLEPAAKEFHDAQTKYAEMTKLLGKFDERQKLAYVVDQKRSELQQLQAGIDSGLPKILAGVEQNLQAAQGSKAKAEHSVTEATNLWQDRRTSASGAVAAHRRQHAELTREMQEAEAALAKGICPTCGQAMKDGHSPRVDILRQKLASEEKDLAECLVQFKVLDTQPENLTAANERLGLATAAVAEAERELMSIQHQANSQREIAAKIDALQIQIRTAEKQIADSPSAFDRAAYDAICERLESLKVDHGRWTQLAHADDEAARARMLRDEKKSQFEAEKRLNDHDQARLKELGLTEGEAQQIVEDHVRLEHSIPLLEQALEKATQAVTLAKTAICECEARIAERKKKAEEVDGLKYEQILYKEVGDAMQELRQRLNAQIRPTLETFAGDTLAQITDNRYTRVHIDEAFRACIYDGETRKSVISGGEEDVLALSLRIALSRYVQEKSGLPLSMLVLDEVFGSLDSDRRQNVIGMLAGLRDLFPQVIVISHVESLPDNADRVIRVRYDTREKRSVIEESLPEAALL